MTGQELRPRAGSSAKDVLLTILGEFTLAHRGAVWTSTVVSALSALGFDEGNARQAIARIAELGIVSSEREGRRVRWVLTDHGRRLLTAGTTRIYEFGSSGETWDGRWLVLLFSVPEGQRAKRHQLRSQLGFAGFGFLAPGVAMSPHVDRERAANEVLADVGCAEGSVVLRAETGELVEPSDLLGRAWDLDALGASYESFIAAFGARTPRSPEEQFASLVSLVHEWRRFPFVDPEIPMKLLPTGWPGQGAKRLFDQRHASWSPAANTWYQELDSTAD